VKGSILWARALHTVAALAVGAAGLLAGRAWGWGLGSAILAAVLVAEHRHVAPGGVLMPERITIAFFNYNAFASVAFALCAVLDLALR
jgi:4-hydroxybenzoate polyprenyltransferase